MKSSASIIDMCVSLHAFSKNQNNAALNLAIERAIKTAQNEVAAKRMLCENCASEVKNTDYQGQNAQS